MNILCLGFVLFSLNCFAQVGINIIPPTAMLHIKGNGILGPLRVEGLQSTQSNLDHLVSTPAGEIKRQTLNTVSAVRVAGTLNIAVNNTIYDMNATNTPTEEFDNLNEFNGNVFTASRAGLYWVTFTIVFPQRSASIDGGDGYLAYAVINDSAGDGRFINTKIYGPENSLSAATQYMTAKYMAKLNVGQTLSFQTFVYGTGGNLNGVNYKINMVRLD